MSIIEKIKDQFRIAKDQIMYKYEQGASTGKALKKSHKEKLRRKHEKNK